MFDAPPPSPPTVNRCHPLCCVTGGPFTVCAVRSLTVCCGVRPLTSTLPDPMRDAAHPRSRPIADRHHPPTWSPQSSGEDVPDYASMAVGCCIPLLPTEGESDDPWAEFKPDSGKLSFATLRLFESEWFNMSMAVSYLHEYDDEDVQRCKPSQAPSSKRLPKLALSACTCSADRRFSLHL